MVVHKDFISGREGYLRGRLIGLNASSWGKVLDLEGTRSLEGKCFTGVMSSFASNGGDSDPADSNRAPGGRGGRAGTEKVPEDEAECEVSIGIGPEMRSPWLVGVTLRCLANEIIEKVCLRPVLFGSGTLGSTAALYKLRRASDWAILPWARTSAADSLAISKDFPTELIELCAEVCICS